MWRAVTQGAKGSRLTLALLALLWLVMPAQGPALAQDATAEETVDPATLVADSIGLTADNVLTAAGNVELFYQGRTLQATKVVYDPATDRLLIEGPLRLTDEDTGTVVLGSQADLAADMTEGILASARVILNRQLQITATEVRRGQGRYTEMVPAIASSCSICGNGPPLWEIRARRVIHDQQAQLLYFEGAQLRIIGVPLAYAPRLRMPDPTLDRATGFLRPLIVTSTALGFGIRQPYFITLGPSRDLTLTPLVTDRGARALEAQYRQAFRTGNILLQGAMARDDALPGAGRGYFKADGSFSLPQGFSLTFTGLAVSDTTYFTDYALPYQDRLRWNVAVGRSRLDESISGRVTRYQTLRAGETNLTQPSILTDVSIERRFSLPVLGGMAGIQVQSFAFARASTVAADTDNDGFPDGRDISRLSAQFDWRRDWVLSSGVIVAALADVRGDVYGVQDDSLFDGRILRGHGSGGVELRYPLVKREAATGARQVLEPVMQVLVSPTTPATVPNEDSPIADFDEGNLFSFSHFPGVDRLETGPRVNMGLRWTREAGTGWVLGTALGRVWRETAPGGFNTGSGLADAESDWLAALRVTLPYGLTATARSLIADDLRLTRGEMIFAVSRPRYDLSSTYLWAQPDAADGRLVQTSEVLMSAGYYMTPQWRARASTRYDLEGEREVSTDLGLTFRNECLLFDVSLSRRSNASTTVADVTTVVVDLDFLGFGGARGAGPARVCRR